MPQTYSEQIMTNSDFLNQGSPAPPRPFGSTWNHLKVVTLRQIMSRLPVPTRFLEPLIQVLRLDLAPLDAPQVLWDRSRSFRIAIDDPSDHVQTYMFFQGRFEGPETRLVRDHLAEGNVFVDIGANVGWFTLAAASKVGRTGRVLAFEPFPASFQRLQRNVALNGFQTVTAFEMGLGDADAVAPVYAGTGNSGRTSLFPDPDQATASQIQLRRAEDVLAETGVEGIDFCKIDVEGAELLVLDGLGRYLRDGRIGAMLIEINPMKLEQAGGSAAALYDRLVASGFHVYDVRRPAVRLASAPDRFMNVLCRHESLDAR